jgi:D-tyrosyl-tRNA(Tyr) deacylase
MIGLIQLVKYADVNVNGSIVGAIQRGILALIGLEKTDTEQAAKKLFQKIVNYRIFPDANDKTNLSLKNIAGGLLLVPQFTLVAETQKGLRPGFSLGMSPEEGKNLFEFLTSHAKKHYAHVETGQYGAYMQVSLCNDGPMTFLLRTA